MPKVMQNKRGLYTLSRIPLDTPPTGWEVVYSDPDPDACMDYIRSHWPDPFLSNAAATTTDSALAPPRCRPLPSKLPVGVSCPYPHDNPSMRVLVFPHAGAGPSAYHPLATSFRGTDIEIVIVAYSGREMRYRTDPASSMDDLIRDFESHISTILELGPFALYGHSMGAIAAFEYCRHINQTNKSSPVFMVLTGRHAPSLGGHDMSVSHLSDDDFLDAVGKRYNAIPQEVLDTPELLELLLPALRADFNLVANYSYQPGKIVGVPTILVNGTQDQWISRETAQPWDQAVTVTEQHWLQGDHFFLTSNLGPVKEIIISAFAKYHTLV